MRKAVAIILVLSLAAGAVAGPTGKPRPEPPAAARRRLGSIAGQLDVRLRLIRALGGSSLAAAIRHNEQVWEDLTPEQRGRHRKQALAFLEKDKKEQTKLLDRYKKLLQLSPEKQKAYQERARWLKVVVASFTPAERETLRNLAPKQRARRLLQRKGELIRQGKLPPDQPATAPASAPTTHAAR